MCYAKKVYAVRVSEYDAPLTIERIPPIQYNASNILDVCKRPMLIPLNVFLFVNYDPSSPLVITRNFKPRAMKEYSFILRVLLIQHNGLWAAQCIDHDIVAQGKSLREAKAAFEQTIIGQILFDIKRGREPLASFPAAPAHLQELYEKAADVTLDDKGPLLPDVPEGTPDAYICNHITKEFRVWD